VPNAGSGERPRQAVDRLQAEVAELRGSRKRLAEAAHADRREIERALHDGVHQDLVALAVELRRLAGLVDTDPAAAKALIETMTVNVRQALDETTELAERIYPPLLDVRGFASAMRSAAEKAGVTIVVDIPTGASYPPEITAALYWSCLEALSSASRGSQAAVSMRDSDGVLIFDVVVAGRDPEDGLDRMRDRIEALDGHVDVDDRQAGVAHIHGWLPLPR